MALLNLWRRRFPRRRSRNYLVATTRWGLTDAVVGYLVGIVAGATASGIAVSIHGDSYGLPVLIAGSVGLWVGFIGAPLVATRWRGRASLARDFGFEARWTDAFIGVPAGVSAQLVVVPAIYLPIRLFTRVDTDGPARQLTERARGPGMVALVAVVVIGAPIAEELFFRGLLLRSAIGRYGPGRGILLTTTIFAATHFQLVQFPGLFIAGLLLAGLAVTTDRLGPAIWAHAAFNATTVLLLLLTTAQR